jgi:hypothetical protein
MHGSLVLVGGGRRGFKTGPNIQLTGNEYKRKKTACALARPITHKGHKRWQ